MSETKTKTGERSEETKSRRATTNGAAAQARGLAHLQQAAGNQALQSLLHAGLLKAQLTVSQPHDPDEQEADHIAGQVMREKAASNIKFASGVIHRQCAACAASPVACPECQATPRIQRRARATGGDASASLPAPLATSLGSGRPLAPSVRDFFEPRFGHDFSHVRIHTEPYAAASADALGAHAYTVGRHIAFASGQYAPESAAGQRLLAHELTHVVQHTGDPLIRREAAGFFSGLGASLSGAFSSGVQTVSNVFNQGVNAVSGFVTQGAATVSNTLGQGVTNLGQLLGFGAPGEGSPQVLRTIVAVLNNPLVQSVLMLMPPPGMGNILQAQASTLAAMLSFMDFAWQSYQNPQPLLDAIRLALGQKMAQVGPLAMDFATAALPAGAPNRDGALDCIGRHLLPKLSYIAANWWDVLLSMGQDLLWPWPGVASDFGQLWIQLKLAGSALWDLRLNDALDHLLAVLRHLNAALGRLYGWFLLASVLIGAILGGIAGAAAGGVVIGPGILAGAGAGLAFAGEVGMGMLIATFIIEGASIAQSSLNLARAERTVAQRECDCEIIASSSITIAIAGALAALGAIAARLGKALLQRIANRLFDPPQRPPRSTDRGRVVEARVTLGELVKAVFNRRRVTVTDRLTPGGLLGNRGNFPGIDMAADAQVTIRSQGQTISDAAGLRAAMRNNQPINVDINGGSLISVRSRGGSNVARALRGDIKELANFAGGTSPSFTPGSTSTVTATVANATSKVLVAVFEPGRLTAAEIANLQALATSRGITLRLHEGIPPNPVAVTTIESMPGILGELAAEGSQVAVEPQEAATLHCVLSP